MEKLFESKLFPLITMLVSIGIGIISSILGASLGISILISVLFELLLTSHHSIYKVNELQRLLGYTQGISHMSKILPAVHALVTNGNKWSRTLLTSKLERFSLEIDGIEKQRCSLSTDEFMDFAEIFFSRLNKNDKVCATSLFGGGDYWKRKYGVKYALLNKEAAQRGASITRVFIPKDVADKNNLEQIFKAQSSYINVKVVEFDELAEVDRHASRDFLILSNQIVFEFIFDAQFRDIDHVVVITAPDEVASYQKKMKKILEISQDFVPQ